MENEEKKFLETFRKIQKLLKWDVRWNCSKCHRKNIDDAFDIILENSWCTNCERPIAIARKVDEKLGEEGVFVFPNMAGYISNWLHAKKYLKEYQYLFLNGFLTGYSYIHLDVPGLEPDIVTDVSIGIVRMYGALELFLASKIKEKLSELHTNQCVISIIMETMRPNVKDYVDMIDKLKIHYNKKEFDQLFEYQKIRNKIIHSGYNANFGEFLKIFTSISRIFSPVDSK